MNMTAKFANPGERALLISHCITSELLLTHLEVGYETYPIEMTDVAGPRHYIPGIPRKRVEFKGEVVGTMVMTSGAFAEASLVRRVARGVENKRLTDEEDLAVRVLEGDRAAVYPLLLRIIAAGTVTG